MPPPYIQIKDNFASLKNVKNIPVENNVFSLINTLPNDAELTFKLSYDIKQSDVINSNITKINVKIYNESQSQPSIFNAREVGFINSRELIHRIQVQRRDAFEGYLTNETKIIAQTTSDPTAFVNNEIIAKLRQKSISTKSMELANEYIGLGSSLSKVSNEDFPAGISDTMTVPLELKFLTSNISSKSGYVFVTFEVIDVSKNQILEIISRQIDVYKHLDKWNLPTSPPIITSFFDRKKFFVDTKLNVRQTDKSANGIKVYRKIIFSNSKNDNFYEFLGDFFVEPRQSIDLKFVHPIDSMVKYRIIPHNNNKISSVFSEVSHKDKFFSLKSLSLTSRVIDSGIKLECRNMSSDVVSIFFLQRNLTLKERTFKIIGESKIVSENETITHVAKNLINNHTYEFSTRCLHKNALSYDVGNEICSFMKSSPGLMNISVENMSIERIGWNDEPDITFNVKILLSDSELNKIKDAMEVAGVRDYFDQNILNAKNNLNPILFFQVERINLMTGNKENLGIFPYREDFKFHDLIESTKTGASPLRRGNVYRYAIGGIIWHPDVISNTGKKKKKDPITGISYTYEPRKWGDPLSLKNGTITPLKSNDDIVSINRGLTGNIIYVDVSLKNTSEILGISAFNAELFDDNKISLKWISNLNAKEIDHFIIMNNSDAVPIQIGTAHAQSDNFSYEWIYEIQDKHPRHVFSLIPVNVFGEKMQEYTSNTIENSI